MTPISVVPVRWGRDDDDDDDGPAELRTYRIADQAGNTLLLVERVRKKGHEIKARIESLQYNGGPVVTPPRNKKQYEWSLNRDGSLRELEQKLEVGQGRAKQEVKAKFDARKNETEIKVERPERKIMRPGLALLRLATSQGGLVIEY